MKDATLNQARKILELFEDVPKEQTQALLTSGLLTDLRDANIANINRDEFRRLVGLKPSRQVKEATSFYVETLGHWTVFWQTLGIAAPDFSGLKTFEERLGFRPILFPKSEIITPQWLFERCHECFFCWRYEQHLCESLNEAAVKNDRDPRSGAYVAWFPDRIEADEELRNLSANELERRAITGITLAERLVLELDYFARTGKHLDIESKTLCSGSRCDFGGVPSVRWSGCRLDVNWCSPNHLDLSLRTRRMFS